MSTTALAALFVTLAIFAFSLLLIAQLHYQIYYHLSLLVTVWTGSSRRASVIYFLLMLPGIIVHEGAHWLVAKVLGLKPGKFRVWPKMQKGGSLRLGSVTARRGGVWLDFLVGMAPLLAGSLVIGLIGQHVFATGNMVEAFMVGDGQQMWQLLRSALFTTDGPLWAYLLFAIANGMMPSAPDREPARPVLLYTLLAVSLYILLGLPLSPLAQMFTLLIRPLELLGSALILVVLLNLLVLTILALLTLVLVKR